MIFRVLDIETIPDFSVWTPGEDQYRLIPGPVMIPRGMDITETGLSGPASPLKACVERIKPFPPPHACRVVALSTVDIVLDIMHSPRYRFDSAVTDCCWDTNPPGSPCPLDQVIERELLKDFSDRMIGSEITIVTWNGRGFDLPVLSMRSLKLGIPFGWYYSNRDMRYRYSDTGHLDLMDYLGDYGAARHAKLGDVAKLIGLPGKVGEVSGAGVHDIYKSTVGLVDGVSEKQRLVGRYCLQDTIETALIFLRSRFHLGKIEREEYNLCLDTFAQSSVINETLAIKWGNLKL